MSKLPRDMYKKIKKMDSSEMFTFWKNMMEQGYSEGYEAGYSEGITANLDSDEFIVMDEDYARQKLSDEEFMRLIGETE